MTVRHLKRKHKEIIMRDKLYNFVAKYPIWVILACITFVVIAASGAQNLVFKNDYRVFFGKGNPQLTAFESMQNIYNKTDNVAFVVVPKDGNVFTKAHLNALKSLTKESWQVPFSTRVDSVTNFQYTYAEEDDMIVEDLVMNTSNLSVAALDKIRNIAINEPLLVNKIISSTGHVSVVNVTVQLPGIAPLTETPQVAESVRAIKAKFLAEYPDTEVYLSGMIMMNTSFTESALDDNATLIPLDVFSGYCCYWFITSHYHWHNRDSAYYYHQYCYNHGACRLVRFLFNRAICLSTNHDTHFSGC